MIKKAICLAAITALVITVSCKKEQKPLPKPDGAGNAAMEFKEKVHDFGTINAGDKVETNFVFTNTGTEDLVITQAKGSCGCTVPEKPEGPIKPGEEGTIKVSFNSTGKSGSQHKIVTLMANTPNGTETLEIKASVTPKTGIAQ